MAEENGGAARSHEKFVTLKRDLDRCNITTKNAINAILCQSEYMAGIRRLKQSRCGVGAVCQMLLIRGLKFQDHSFKVTRDATRAGWGKQESKTKR